MPEKDTHRTGRGPRALVCPLLFYSYNVLYITGPTVIFILSGYIFVKHLKFAGLEK